MSNGLLEISLGSTHIIIICGCDCTSPEVLPTHTHWWSFPLSEHRYLQLFIVLFLSFSGLMVLQCGRYSVEERFHILEVIFSISQKDWSKAIDCLSLTIWPVPNKCKHQSSTIHILYPSCKLAPFTHSRYEISSET